MIIVFVAKPCGDELGDGADSFIVGRGLEATAAGDGQMRKDAAFKILD